MRKTLLVAFAAMFSVASMPAFAGSFIVSIKGNSDRLLADIEAAGGVVTSDLSVINVLVVDADDASAFDGIAGIDAVMEDVMIEYREPLKSEVNIDFAAPEAASPPFTGDDDFFFDLQWGHTAISATDAWAAGHRGAGVRVAVLDSGIDAEHPDIAPNLNAALSASFIPGEGWNVRPGTFFNHGTHVAGTIAAADNGFGIIGVAPDAEIIAVKVLSEYSGGGSFSAILNGIVYSAQVGADVINMSLGASIPRNCGVNVPGNVGNASACADFFSVFARGVKYARDMGATVIASAGNDARDLDHDSSLKKFPAEVNGVLSISATGPTGWALDPVNADLDKLASYSNYGQSSIDFSAPGGDYIYPGNDVCAVVVYQYCWAMDMVFSTISGGWSWSAGTSMAAPHASGVAALIIGKNGGSMDPQAVEKALRQSADDLGKAGNDDAHGMGRVNALRAVE
ncbi:MAG: S8 family serine peptidase [Gammaproteobacteria bacterium]|nr:S8 family serine peptidase [Gammaproteobacteria bacterium]